MMFREFCEIAKMEIDYTAYAEFVEPRYKNQDLDKYKFCRQFKKEFEYIDSTLSESEYSSQSYKVQKYLGLETGTDYYFNSGSAMNFIHDKYGFDYAVTELITYVPTFFRAKKTGEVYIAGYRSERLGFYDYEKKNHYVVFKMRDLSNHCTQIWEYANRHLTCVTEIVDEFNIDWFEYKHPECLDCYLLKKKKAA